ncbi:MAG: amidohydrolase family protein [Lentisphaeria bacterium]|nr:amidohydrolase family protein [Lentisphaeria bacterium]
MFDINVAVGHWPFRRIPHQSAESLRHHLRRHGISGAAATHTHGLFYRNCHDANLELAEMLAAHGDFFVGIATLNPAYPAWEKDLAACVGALRMAGVRLAPAYHNYALGNACARDLVRAAAACGVPVFVPHRIVDVRQRHWLDTETVVTPGEVIALARAVPEARIVFLEYPVSPGVVAAADGTVLCPNLYVETSRMVSAYGQVLAAVVRAAGPERVLFGSGAPFKEVMPATLKLAHAELTEAERILVCGGTAARLLARTPGAGP